MNIWTELYRPKEVEDYVFQNPEQKEQVNKWISQGKIPHLLFSGSPGTGKTTLAKLLIHKLGVQDHDILEINASRERGIDTIRNTIVKFSSTMPFGDFKVILMDEADYLTPEAQAALRGAIEEFSDNCSFIFTCNFKARLIDAIHSRCSVIDFTLHSDEKPKMAAEFFARLGDILTQENISYDKAALIEIVKKFFPDYRRTLNEIQRFSKNRKIDAGVIAQISLIRSMMELTSYLKEKNFSEMRKWVVANTDIDSARLFRKIYDGLYEYLKPEFIPQAVVILARYQYQSAFVADQEINLVACLTEIMVDCEIR